jgi:hypothetical protein
VYRSPVGIHLRAGAVVATLLGLAPGCGGGGRSDGGAPDATSQPPSGDGGSDGRATCPGDVIFTGSHVPLDHRPARASCPAERAPSSFSTCPCSAPDSGGCPCGACGADSDCIAGRNGRCNQEGPIGVATCSYDECFADSDCDGGAPCQCRSSSTSPAANTCRTRSQCRTDSDCGPGGYCSPSILEPFCTCPSTALCGDAGGCFAGSQPVPCMCGEACGHGYFCHTPCDLCFNDTDCRGGATCNYDTLARRWQCQACLVPP